MGESILDKVISSKQNEQMREFNPPEAIAALFRQLSNKEEDILRRRYGLNGQTKQTLEEIGQFYKLTRERIRQIECTAVKKLKKVRGFHDIINPIETTLRSVIDQHGGAVSKDRLFELIFEFSPNTDINRQSVTFIITKLLDDVFLDMPSTAVLRSGWRSASVSLTQVNMLIDRLVEIIRERNQPTNEADLIELYHQKNPSDAGASGVTDQALLGYLTLSQKISRNPFGDYGLTEWGTIVPKRMNDKIYLVLKKADKPMHFTEIAEQINKIGFDSRRAYPPTVHNELILNHRYVLVGRGIYALREWGYRPGVVSDVIIEIMKKNGQPMTRDEIVDAVMSQRIVKKNTIHLALTERSVFEKLPDGRYQLSTVPASTAPNQPAIQTKI
jgi:hypothetical protein